MLVRMLVHMAGHLISHDVGDEVTFPDDAGQRLVDAGFAEKVAKKIVKDTVERADRKANIETR